MPASPTATAAAAPPGDPDAADGHDGHDGTVAARVTALTKTYGAGATLVTALDSVDLTITRGRFTAVMGPSGSGKSTLMHCLAGLDSPTSGSVRVAGVEVSALGDDALTRFRREHIGFVFQSFNLLPMLTAEQNIWLPVQLAKQPRDTDWFAHVTSVLGIGGRLGHRPGELSGGQQQRVALARGLVMRPTILFADEPTGNLDSATSVEVLAFLRRSVRELGQTVVMVTHDPRAAEYADEVVDLEDGRIREVRR
jgi:putative ABC transport system ATP-binding protein